MAFAIFFFYGCKKDHKVLGIEVQPEDDQLGAQLRTNYPVYAHTIDYDSVVSFNTNLKYLGTNNDPHFGKLDIGLYLNANMSVTNLDFGSTAELSSAEIVLAISNTDYAGLNGAALTFSVYPLDSLLVPTRAYYTNVNYLHNEGQLLSSSTSTYTFIDGRLVLRIPVDSVYASTILKNPEYLKDNATFQDRYRGFYIKTSCGLDEGVIYNCNLEDPLSGFFLHFRPTPADTIQDFQFLFSGSGSSKFNTVKFTPSPPLSTQMNGDTALGGENTYLLGMGATRLRVQIPFLRNLSDSFSVAVNRAEVIFNVDEIYISSAESYSLVPPKLALLALDSLGREKLCVDQANSINVARYDGYYDTNKKRYIFNIPLHAQGILKGSIRNHGFNLVVADPLFPYTIYRDNSIKRVILAGSNKDTRPVLNLSYTQLRK